MFKYIKEPESSVEVEFCAVSKRKIDLLKLKTAYGSNCVISERLSDAMDECPRLSRSDHRKKHITRLTSEELACLNDPSSKRESTEHEVLAKAGHNDEVHKGPAGIARPTIPLPDQRGFEPRQNQQNDANPITRGGFFNPWLPLKPHFSSISLEWRADHAHKESANERATSERAIERANVGSAALILANFKACN
jgi:hypothetical protein